MTRLIASYQRALAIIRNHVGVTHLAMYFNAGVSGKLAETNSRLRYAIDVRERSTRDAVMLNPGCI